MWPWNKKQRQTTQAWGTVLVSLDSDTSKTRVSLELAWRWKRQEAVLRWTTSASEASPGVRLEVGQQSDRVALPQFVAQCERLCPGLGGLECAWCVELRLGAQAGAEAVPSDAARDQLLELFNAGNALWACRRACLTYAWHGPLPRARDELAAAASWAGDLAQCLDDWAVVEAALHPDGPAPPGPETAERARQAAELLADAEPAAVLRLAPGQAPLEVVLETLTQASRAPPRLELCLDDHAAGAAGLGRRGFPPLVACLVVRRAGQSRARPSPDKHTLQGERPRGLPVVLEAAMVRGHVLLSTQDLRYWRPSHLRLQDWAVRPGTGGLDLDVDTIAEQRRSAAEALVARWVASAGRDTAWLRARWLPTPGPHYFRSTLEVDLAQQPLV